MTFFLPINRALKIRRPKFRTNFDSTAHFNINAQQDVKNILKENIEKKAIQKACHPGASPDSSTSSTYSQLYTNMSTEHENPGHQHLTIYPAESESFNRKVSYSQSRHRLLKATLFHNI
ncbi:hypothetical protein AAHE18_12G071700 [Arachis hypogaea]